MSPGCLPLGLPFPSTHVMLFVDLGLMMGSRFPSGDERLSATYSPREALSARGRKKKKDKYQLTFVLGSGNWSLMCELLFISLPGQRDPASGHRYYKQQDTEMCSFPCPSNGGYFR